MYDFLIVGAGLTGSVLARELTDRGKHVLVIEKEPETLGGACATRLGPGGVVRHLHGPHIFHTDSLQAENYVKRFARWYPTKLSIRAHTSRGLLSFPINLLTMEQLGFNFRSSYQMLWYLGRFQTGRWNNFQEVLEDRIGPELYNLFYRDYTHKQWGMAGDQLPAALAKRIPIKYDYDPTRFTNRCEMLPEGGYDEFFRSILDGIEVKMGSDYFEYRDLYDHLARKVIYTGPIDRLFMPKAVGLAYRSLKFDWYDTPDDIQGGFCVNECTPEKPYTRVLDYKYLMEKQNDRMIGYCVETPANFDGKNTPYYPLPRPFYQELAKNYVEMAKASGYIPAGRLGTYRYIDMDQAVLEALSLADKIL